MARTKNILKCKTADEAYEAACKYLDTPVKTLRQFVRLHGKEEGPAFYSLHRITTGIKALKKGHKFDWGNWQERKYYPWANMPNASGSAFSLYVVDFVNAITIVGARLSSKTDAEARALFHLFQDDYEKWMVD